MNDRSSTEAVLASAYAAEAVCYAGALRAAENLSVALKQGAGGDAEVAELVTRLHHVQEIETRIAVAKSAWQKSNNKPGPELSATLSQVAEVIQKLISCLQGAEETANSRQKAVIQDLEDLARGKNMQRAYETARTFADDALTLS